MKLYWAPQTRSVRTVWMLEETGLEYDVEPITLGDEANANNTEFMDASPMGKVPALVDGDLRMSDSAAICLYLADRYRMGDLAPALDDPLRGKYLYWLTYTPAVIEPAMAEKMSGAEPNPRSYGWGSFDSMLETMVSGIGEGPWILGEQFTAADVMLGSSVHFLMLFNMIPEEGPLAVYVERCRARPAFQAAQSRETT
ncbi:MAG: glutathione S-transferase family protein [Pseudomonadota bacterium]